MRFLVCLPFLSLLVAGLVAGCGDANGRSGIYSGMSYCQDLGASYHFKAFVPPWKHRKEYRCDQGDFRNCSHWTPTGRFVFVVSESPFVNFDSEIIVSLTVEPLAGNALTHVQARIAEVNQDSKAELLPASTEKAYYEFSTDAGQAVLDLYWRQKRTFENKEYNWHRRDSYIQTTAAIVYHLEFFSIMTMSQPEFDALVKSFQVGAAPDGAPHCVCKDEHSTTVTDCI